MKKQNAAYNKFLTTNAVRNLDFNLQKMWNLPLSLKKLLFNKKKTKTLNIKETNSQI